MMTKKYTSIVAHFEGLVDAPALCGVLSRATGSNWKQPSGNYSLQIAPAAARVTANKTIMKNAPTLLAISMAMAVCRYNTMCIAQWRRPRTMLDATDCHHWASIAANKSNWTYQR